MAKKKKKRKAKKSKVASVNSFSTNYSKQALYASKMPIYEALVPEELEDQGMGSLVLSRTMPDGNIAYSLFLLDVFCLGVKNADFGIVSIFEYKELLQNIQSHETPSPVPPSCLRKLVKDCILYAKNIGFQPHKDYKIAAKLFGDITSEESSKTYTFGKNGKPLFIAGPFDDEIKIDKITKTLHKTCGEGNYEFVLPIGNMDDFI